MQIKRFGAHQSGVSAAAAIEFEAVMERISVLGPRTCDKWRVKSSLTAGGFEIDGHLRSILPLWKSFALHPQSRKQRGIP